MTQMQTGRAARAYADHRPVMLEAALHALDVKPAGRYLDATFGRGGHSRALLERLGEEGRLVGFDRDPEAVAAGLELAAADPRFSIVRGNFAEIDAHLPESSLDGILFDFGVSSPQLDQAERGFSFMRDGPLDMRMDPDSGVSAAQWLGTVTEFELADTLKNYGEEKHARRLAREILARQAAEPFTRTLELAEFIASVLPRSRDGIHPATRAFQAIRIAVNSEIRAIERGMDAAHFLLGPEGRLVAISFHSLEDRLVKQFIALHSRPPQGSRRLPPTTAAPSSLRDLGKQRADDAELSINPRARSAVMRVAERLR